MSQELITELVAEFAKLNEFPEDDEASADLTGDGDRHGGLAADAVRKLRIEKGMSLTAFAQHIGMAANNLAALEKGARPPTVRTLQQIADRCGMRLQLAFRPIGRAEGNIVHLPGRSSNSGDPPNAA